MKKLLLLLTAWLVVACGGNQRPLPSQQDLLRQDSLERIARAQRVKHPIGTAEEEILSNLPLHPLPVTYQEGFEMVLPGFEDVPPTMVMPLSRSSS